MTRALIFVDDDDDDDDDDEKEGSLVIPVSILPTSVSSLWYFSNFLTKIMQFCCANTLLLIYAYFCAPLTNLSSTLNCYFNLFSSILLFNP
jgi:hypothetical protein